MASNSGLNAGDLDRRITVEVASSTQDAFSQKVTTWATALVVWAGKQDVSDGERTSAQEVAADITTRFQIRWSAAARAIQPSTHRVRYGARVYDIVAVKEIGFRDGIEISATARAETAVP
jgi:SPP1 family predicted phage head-tail adaptor